MIPYWYVGFMNRKPEDKGAWFSFLTDDEFAHVLCMGFDPLANTWVVYDPSYFGVSITLLAADDPIVTALIEEVPRWLKWNAEKTEPVRTFGLTWCVPAVCRVIGVRSCALRPRALYRDLVRKGATPWVR